MRTIVRVGVIIGGIGFVALFALQALIALGVAYCLLIVGFATGLSIAKWLERPWFGRQLMAGLRAGALAVGISGAGALLSLLVVGPHDKTLLATHSRLLTFSMAQWIGSLAVLTWAGIDILTILLAGLTGVGLSVLTAQIFAWSKNRRAIHIVTQARQAAQALSRADTPSPSPSTGSHSNSQNSYFTGAPAMSGGGITGTLGTQAGVPHPATTQDASTIGMLPGAPAAPRRTLGAVPPTPPTGISGTRRAPLPRNKQVDDEYPAPTEPLFPSAAPSEDQTSRRTPSKARPAGNHLTDAMREALATWASDNVAEETPGERTGPQPSAYLNSSRPLPKRNRKKQNTRDWLC